MKLTPFKNDNDNGKEEKRGLLESNVFMLEHNKTQKNKVTVKRAVDDGYSINHHVYNAVNIIADNLKTVELEVYNSKGERIPNHPLSKILSKPHPQLSRSKFMELLAKHLLLSGSSYIHKIKTTDFNTGRNKVGGLYLINPDILRPISDTNKDAILAGFEEMMSNGMFKLSEQFTKDDTFIINNPDPSNPLKGISPVEALARVIDLDNEQRSFHRQVLENGGGVSSLIAFEGGGPMNEKDALSFYDKLKMRITGSNKGMPAIVGQKAQVHRIGLSNQELQYLDSLNLNRDDIYTAFKIPPAFYNTKSQTYNNMKESSKILWSNCILNYLNDIIDQFNIAFEKELGAGNYIYFDKSKITALSDYSSEKMKEAMLLKENGVPMKILNEKYELGLEEYEGWDLPYDGLKQKPESRSNQGVSQEERSLKKKNLN